MIIDDFISCFGKAATEPEVEVLIRQLGIKKGPKLPKGEFDAYLEAKGQGVCLLFEDEAYLNKKDVPLGKSPLIFIGVFFYSQGVDGYSAYRGQLLEGLSITDIRQKLLAVLGEPSRRKDKNGLVRDETWERPGYRFDVRYSNGENIQEVYCGIV